MNEGEFWSRERKGQGRRSYNAASSYWLLESQGNHRIRFWSRGSLKNIHAEKRSCKAWKGRVSKVSYRRKGVMLSAPSRRRTAALASRSWQGESLNSCFIGYFSQSARASQALLPSVRALDSVLDLSRTI